MIHPLKNMHLIKISCLDSWLRIQFLIFHDLSMLTTTGVQSPLPSSQFVHCTIVRSMSLLNWDQRRFFDNWSGKWRKWVRLIEFVQLIQFLMIHSQVFIASVLFFWKSSLLCHYLVNQRVSSLWSHYPSWTLSLPPNNLKFD